MNQITFFRVSIVASVVLGVLGACVDDLIPELVPPVLREAYDHQAAEDFSTPYVLTMAVMALIMLIGFIAGTVGLYLFRSWALRLSLWLSALGAVIMPYIGPVVHSGWAAMLTELSMMLWGAVLAMAYFSELRGRFQGASATDTLVGDHKDTRA